MLSTVYNTKHWTHQCGAEKRSLPCTAFYGNMAYGGVVQSANRRALPLSGFCRGRKQTTSISNEQVHSVSYDCNEPNRTFFIGGAMVYFKRFSGFTLIELMIVIAVIGILSAIVYPSYTEYVKRAKRADGKAGLLSLQQAQEKYRANCPQYADGIHATTRTCVSGGTHNLVASTSSPDGHYTLAIVDDDTIPTPTSTIYTITATPNFTDAKCGTLGINQAGDKTVTGTDSVDNCWGR